MGEMAMTRVENSVSISPELADEIARRPTAAAAVDWARGALTGLDAPCGLRFRIGELDLGEQRSFERGVQTMRYDLMLADNLRLLHGQPRAHRERRLARFYMTLADAAGDEYESWLANRWRITTREAPAVART
jgi:hypothetical protein